MRKLRKSETMKAGHANKEKFTYRHVPRSTFHIPRFTFHVLGVREYGLTNYSYFRID